MIHHEHPTALARVGLLCAALAAPLAAVPSAGAAVIHVDASAPSGGSGSSWATAFPSLQVAFDFAIAGDEIWVAAGIYKTPGVPYVMPEWTALYGGFAGTETMLAQRDPEANPVVLDGQKTTRILEFQSSGPTIVDGIVFRDGLTGTQGGAAMYEYDLEADVANCVFIGNKAVGGDGGAVAFYTGDVSFTNCRFVDNVAGNAVGGAVSNYEGDVWFERCVFDGNKAITAAVYESYTGSCTFLNSLFVRNKAFESASLVEIYQTTVGVVNCTATMNTADGAYTIGASQTAVEVHNSIFFGNVVNAAGGGQGKEFPDSVVVTHSLVEDGFPGPGNVQGNPNFVSAVNDDFRPLYPSPVLDASDNNAIPAGVTLDLLGNPRFIDLAIVPDTGSGPPPLADMGAIESLCENPPIAYGQGCVGAGSLVPEIRVSSCPAIGSPLAMEFANALGGATAVVFAGTGQAQIPMSPHCSFLLSPILPPLFSLPLGGSGPGNGHAILSGTVPASTPVGAVVTWQFFVADPSAADGFAASHGLSIQFN